MGLFSKGYKAQREEKDRQDKAREESGKRLYQFFIPAPKRSRDSAEKDVRFLTEEPINFNQHTVKTGDTYKNYTCTGKNCPLCADGNKATFKGAYLVIDRSEFEYTDKDGKKQTGCDQVRLFVQGTRVVSQLDRISSKYGLSNREVTVVRMGKGTDTTYTVEKGDKEPLDEEEIEDLLPEKLREDYDGTMESLYGIVEDQLMLYAPDGSEEEEEEDEDDDYDEDDVIIGADEDEDDEDEPPKRSLKKKKEIFKSGGSSTKKKKLRRK